MRTSNPTELALLDTNILVYADQEEEPYHRAAKALRDQGKQGRIPICLAPQVLNEFFAIVTRTGKHHASRPMSTQEAAEEVKKYLDAEHILMIYPTPTTWPTMLSLLEQHPVRGQDIHDLHLAATMLSNGIKKIYTFNTRDFAPFSEIEAITPSETEPESESAPSPQPGHPLTGDHTD